MRALLVAAVLALSSGCLVNTDYQGTHFRCQESGKCPKGYECVQDFCEPVGGDDAGTPESDAAAGLDAGTADAGGTDGGLDAALR